MIVYHGFDAYRLTGWKLFIGLFKRPDVAFGGLLHRFNIAFHISRQFGFMVAIHTYPAWADVPSVKAEYERTMRHV
jgi:hypothetical protein